ERDAGPAAHTAIGLRVAGVTLALLLDAIDPAAEGGIGDGLLATDDVDGATDRGAVALQQLHVDVNATEGQRIEPGKGAQPAPGHQQREHHDHGPALHLTRPRFTRTAPAPA